MKIIWLSEAEKSIDSIYDFFAGKNIQAANSIYNQILEEIEILASFPELGKIDEKLCSIKTRTYRSLIIMSGDYKVIYYTKNNILYIAYIWVCRQSPNYHIKTIQNIEQKNEQEEENFNKNVPGEPAIQYGKQEDTEMTFSPPLTEEELKNAMTGDELREYMRKHIHALFNEK